MKKRTLEVSEETYNAASASQAGLSLEETAATMMNLANNGLRASTIGTGLRRVLSSLIAPNAKLRKAFQAHGIELSKINPLETCPTNRTNVKQKEKP